MKEWKEEYSTLTRNRNIVSYILLSIITCGIYQIYFMYKYIKDINLICEGDKKESPNVGMYILFNIISCNMYNFYWIYSQENRMRNYGHENSIDIKESGATLLLILALSYVVSIIGSFVVQFTVGFTSYWDVNSSEMLLIIIPIYLVIIILSIIPYIYVWNVLIKNINIILEDIYKNKKDENVYKNVEEKNPYKNIDK